MAWQPKGNIRGPQGIAGPPGSQGIQGPPGSTGSQGPAGTPGEKWGSGAGAPGGTMSMAVGDWYLDTNNGNVFEQTSSGVWTLRANIKGPTGAQGTQGIQGIQGPQGNTGAAGTPGEVWFTGAGAPSTGIGAVGDWFLRSDTGDYYEKTAAAVWTLRGSLKGATGSTGSQGSQGIQGPAGADGAGVPAGGTAEQILFKNSSTNFDTAWKSFASLQNTPASGAALTGVATKHFGFGATCKLTPTASGKVLIHFMGIASLTVAGTQGTFYMHYGTGTAPANGAGATGTAVALSALGLTGSPMALMAVLSLAPGTQYWFDIAATANNASGVLNFSSPYFTAVELP